MLPHDLKRLTVPELESLAQDIRQRILTVCAKNGGHLGASLGAVELAIALHFVFDSPEEPILWDVGHQAYAHKLLTGRWGGFESLRKLGGIAGFPSRQESPHDAFGVGHSSTALSAALAMAWSRRNTGKWTVAVVGDGGLTSGLAMAALNNFREKEIGPCLVVINDNQMSISRSVGAIPRIISGGKAGEFFEQFGLNYVGPLDGHDLGSLITVVKNLKSNSAGAPIVLHAVTQKGRGYGPAEEQPGAFHGLKPVVPTPLPEKAPEKRAAGGAEFCSVLGKALCALADTNPKIVAITAAMPEGTGLREFARRHPDRFFDVGIAEDHAVTFAAGLAASGYKPVVAIYSSFLQRGLDQVIHDVALQELGVIFAVDRAGIVGADGATHHGYFDGTYLSMIPGMTVAGPECLSDLPMLLEHALSAGGPWAIRYPRGSGPERFSKPLERGVRVHREPAAPELLAVSAGSATPRVWAACDAADPEVLRIAMISTPFFHPLPAALCEILDRYPEIPVLAVEDACLKGGFGEALRSVRPARAAPIHACGYRNRFIPHGSPAELEDLEGLSVPALTEKMETLLR